MPTGVFRVFANALSAPRPKEKTGMYAISKTRLCLAILVFSATIGASAVAAEQAGPITAERAKEIALAQTGGGNVMELDRHYRGNGTYIYRLEIAGDTGAYHVEIDESDGRLVKLIRKHGYGYHKGNTGGIAPAPGASLPATGILGHDQAMAKALERTGGGAVVESDTDHKRDGRVIYEFEIVNNGVKYDIDIDGVTGNVLKFKQKGRHRLPVATPSQTAGVPAGPAFSGDVLQPRLDAVSAQAIAREKASGGVVVEYKLDTDGGRLVHEMELVNGNTRYEVEIEDATGAVIEFSVD